MLGKMWGVLCVDALRLALRAQPRSG